MFFDLLLLFILQLLLIIYFFLVVVCRHDVWNIHSLNRQQKDLWWTQRTKKHNFMFKYLCLNDNADANCELVEWRIILLEYLSRSNDSIFLPTHTFKSFNYFHKFCDMKIFLGNLRKRNMKNCYENFSNLQCSGMLSLLCFINFVKWLRLYQQ